jgi:hypothetical protein
VEVNKVETTVESEVKETRNTEKKPHSGKYKRMDGFRWAGIECVRPKYLLIIVFALPAAIIAGVFVLFVPLVIQGAILGSVAIASAGIGLLADRRRGLIWRDWYSIKLAIREFPSEFRLRKWLAVGAVGVPAIIAGVPPFSVPNIGWVGLMWMVCVAMAALSHSMEADSVATSRSKLAAKVFGSTVRVLATMGLDRIREWE